jgi:hypothetical protein
VSESTERGDVDAERRALALVELGLDLAGRPGAIAKYLWNLDHDVRMRHAWALLDDLIEVVDTNYDEVWRRIQVDPRLGRLIGEAMRSATETEERELVAALARAAAPGWDDDAKIDEARYIVRALGQLKPMHIRVLRAIEHAAPLQVFVSSTLGCSEGVGQAIAADLVRFGVAVQAMRGPGPVGMVPEPRAVERSPFGTQLLAYLRDHPPDTEADG